MRTRIFFSLFLGVAIGWTVMVAMAADMPSTASPRVIGYLDDDDATLKYAQPKQGLPISGSVDLDAGASVIVEPGVAPITVDGTVTCTPSGTQTVDGTVTAQLQDGAGNALISAEAAPAAGDRGLVVRNIPSGTQTVSGSVTVEPGSVPLSVTIAGGAACIPDLSVDPTCLASCAAAGTTTTTLNTGTYEALVYGELTFVKEAAATGAAGGTPYVPGTQKVITIAADNTDVACRSVGAGGNVCFSPCQ